MGIVDWFRGRRRRKKGLPELQALLDPDKTHDLAQWLESRPPAYRYRRFRIPKRKGGWREIHAPNEYLSDLQRRVYRRLLSRMPVHPAATAYVRGRSIVHNAQPHTGRRVLIKIDLEDFFPSTAAGRVQEMFGRLGWDDRAARVLTRILCHEGGLPQGAPSSPALSNVVNYRLDSRIDGLVRAAGGVYTRYSDDITVSFPRMGGAQMGVVGQIRRVLRESGYRVNGRKGVAVWRGHQRQEVTGLVVNERVSLPREVRRRIRAMRHRRDLGILDETQARRLAGYEALEQMIRDQSAPPREA